MREVFKPRVNMIYNGAFWECRDEKYQLTCDGGPSFIWDSGIWGFIISNIGYHRLDGPATSYGAWWINNINVTKEIKIFAKENSIDLENLTDADKVMIALKFG